MGQVPLPSRPWTGRALFTRPVLINSLVQCDCPKVLPEEENESGAHPIRSSRLDACCSRCKCELSFGSTCFRSLLPYLSGSADFLRRQLQHLSWMPQGRRQFAGLPRLVSLRSSVNQPSLLA